MRIIGLTGGIACGKSTISLTLKSLGALIIDGDQLSRALTQPGGLALPAIRAEFGGEVFHADGTLDRRALGSLILATSARADDLIAAPAEMINGNPPRKRGENLCWTCRALGWADGCNTVGTSPRETQLARRWRAIYPRRSGKPPAQPNRHGRKGAPGERRHPDRRHD
ncbi:MAG: dephospho-CoA kinase [Christensenellales bacterium]